MPEESEKKEVEPEKSAKSEPKNGESKNPTPEVKQQTDEEKTRIAEIVASANALYDAFKGAGFSRDSYIELGESVKHGKDFKAVHPAVQHLIMKVAKKIHNL